MNLLRGTSALVGCLLLVGGVPACSSDHAGVGTAAGSSVSYSYFQLCVTGSRPFDLEELGDLGSPPTSAGSELGPGVMSSNPCQLSGVGMNAKARGRIRADFYSTPSQAAVDQLTAYVTGRLHPDSVSIATGTIHGIAVAFVPKGATKNLALTARDKAELSALLGGLYDTNMTPGGDHSLWYVGPSLPKDTVDRVRTIVALATDVSPNAVVLRRHTPQ